MREAIGGTLILNIALVFIVLINGYLAVSVQYTRAFRVKNQIVSYIEQYEGYNDAARDVIATHLAQVGFRPISGFNCGQPDSIGGTVIEGPGYCVERVSSGPTMGPNMGGSVYRVTTFLSLELPFVGNLYQTFTGVSGIPIRGETRLIFSN